MMFDLLTLLRRELPDAFANLEREGLTPDISPDPDYPVLGFVQEDGDIITETDVRLCHPFYSTLAAAAALAVAQAFQALIED
jgi:hypothetical protein